MNTYVSSDTTTSSSNSEQRDLVNGCDDDTRSQSSLVDSLETDLFSENGEKPVTKFQKPSRLPRLRRSKSVSTPHPVNISGSFVGLSDENRQTPDRFLNKPDSFKVKAQISENFLCLQSGDCGSTHSLCRWNSDTRVLVNETTTSKKRFEMQHSRHDLDVEPTEYLTPSQRKDQLIRELRTHAQELKQALSRRDMSEEQLKEDFEEKVAEEEAKRRRDLETVQKELADMKNKYEELTVSYETSVKSVTDLETSMQELKDTLVTKEQEQDKIYLQMYKKGKQMAQIEREEELHDMMSKGLRSPSFTIRELVRKLAVTESELAKWQSLRRKESYDEGDRPETESEATLRFLKDSFLHYITDAKESDDHLRAMIRIFNFDDDQKKKIAKSLLENKHLKK